MISHRRISPVAESLAKTNAVLRRRSRNNVVITAFDAHSMSFELSYSGVIAIKSGRDDDL